MYRKLTFLVLAVVLLVSGSFWWLRSNRGTAGQASIAPALQTAATKPTAPATGNPLPPAAIAPAQAAAPSTPSHQLSASTLVSLAGLPDFDQLQRGDTVRIPLPSGDVTGTVNLVRREANGVIRIAGSVTGESGSFSLGRDHAGVGGRILLRARDRAYLILSASSPGNAKVLQFALGTVLCDPIPRDRGPAAIRPSTPRVPQSAPPALQSRPGATAVLYLDFDGATVTDPDWNDGNTVNAAASALTSAEITEVWNRVKEDYAPFNINITTVASDYTNAAPGHRMRAIITPTSEWYPDAGGVAYVNSFVRAGSPEWYASDIPAWVFNVSVTGIAEAISHELGHALGLSHDGRTSPEEEYYEGHGSGATSWAPIMGSGYDRSLVQWSQGDYPNANNTEDDVAIISGNQPTPWSVEIEDPTSNATGYVADDAGNSRGAAVTLDVSGPVTRDGLITQAADVNYYAFTLSANRSLALTATPASSYAHEANLDILLQLQASDGTVLAESNPDVALDASISQVLTAGTYYIAVRGTGKTVDGYPSYGSIGQYRLALSTSTTLEAPNFSTRPLSKLLTIGQAATFTAAATGQGSLSYQWKRNGQPISGATSASYSIASAQLADRGNYEVAVSNGGGTIRSFFQVNVVATDQGIAGWSASPSILAASPSAGYPVAQVSGGARQSAALLTNGTVIAWGTADAPEAVVPAGLSGVVAIAAGGNTSLALKADGTVVAWGETYWGQNNIPAGLNQVVGIAVGELHCVAVKADGTVVAWGGEPMWGASSVPAGLANVVAVAAGQNHSLALKADGTVVSWGHDFNTGPQTVPAGLTGVVALSAGSAHNLALKADGSIVAWGGNNYNGETTIPAGAAPAVAIATGNSFSMALKSDGSIRTWGHNAAQLAYPSGFGAASALGAGSEHALALVAPLAPVIVTPPAATTVNEDQTFELTAVVSGVPGPTLQWRKNGTPLVNGERISGTQTTKLRIEGATASDAGDYDIMATNVAGTVDSANATVTVVSYPAFTAIPHSRIAVAGGSLTLEAPAAGATSYTWAKDGSLIASATGATLNLSNLSSADQGVYVVQATNAAGSNKTLFYVRVAAPSAVQAWGDNTYGQTTIPAEAANAVQVSAGLNHTLAVKADGTVIGWGRNQSGQVTIPAGLTGVVQVSAGGSHSVALKSDGTVVAWGDNSSGQCTIPAGLAHVVFVSAGGSHTVALRNDGTVVAWGSDTYGQTSVPSDLRFTTFVSAGLFHNVAITEIGRTSWGRNDFNQLLLPSPDYRTAVAGADYAIGIRYYQGQVDVAGNRPGGIPYGLDNIVEVSVRDRHGLALKTDGGLMAWGPNASGETTIPSLLGTVLAVAAGQAHSVALISAAAPLIHTQPASQTINQGGQVNFSVNALGATGYRWMRNGTDLADGGHFFGTGTEMLTILNVSEAEAGSYSVRVSNNYGNTPSSPATLTVQNLVFAANMVSATSTDGTTETLGVTASGTGTITYQWYVGQSGDTSHAVENATSSSLTVVRSDAQIHYWVRATNAGGSIDSAAMPVGKWTVVDPVFGSSPLAATAYALGRHVVVGQTAGYSFDGMSWRQATIEAGVDLAAVLHDGTRFVAGGRGGQIFISPDGTTWTKQRAADAGSYDLLRSAATANGTTVMVGARERLLSTTDGTNWAWRPITFGSEVIDLLAVSYGAGRFVAVGHDARNYTPRIYHSTDGVNWTRATLSLASSNNSYSFGTLRQIVFFKGRFLAMGESSGYSGAMRFVLTSRDGIEWTPPVFTNVEIKFPIQAAADQTLLSGDLRTSVDGVNWSARPSYQPYRETALGFGNGMFFAMELGGSPTSIATSPDGKDWTIRVGQQVPSDVIYSNGRFVAVRRDRVADSVDGLNWTARAPSGGELGPIASGDGKLLSVSTHTSYAYYYLSLDGGTTWSPQKPASLPDSSLTKVIYSGGRWVAWSLWNIHTSTDALTWNLRHSSSKFIKDVAFDGTCYVAVGNQGLVLRSEDATTWSVITPPTSNDLTYVAYGNGTFVAADTQQNMWTSTDGASWASHALPPKDGGFNTSVSSLIFAQGRFYGVRDRDLLSSPDGASWQVSVNAFPKLSEYYYPYKLVVGPDGLWAAFDAWVISYWLKAPTPPAAPNLLKQPANAAVLAGRSTFFSVTAGGAPEPSCLWQMQAAGQSGWASLSDGSQFTGTQTPVLTVWNTPNSFHNARFRCVLTNSVSGATSAGATLSVVDRHTDFNADGSVDVVWRNPFTGQMVAALMNGTTKQSETTLAITSGYTLGATADFNGDGKPDTLWQNTTTGERGIYLMNGTTFGSWVALGNFSPAYEIVGAADFNSDGKPDTVWQNTTTGERGIYLMNGTALGNWVALGNFAAAYRIAAVADFNGDGKPDTIWQNITTGERGVYLMNGTSFTSWVPLGYFSTDYRIVGAGDYNADGKADTLWLNTVTGERGVYLMNGTSFTSWIGQGYFNPPATATLTNDFNTDGKPDTLWQNTVTGERGLFLMNGTSLGTWSPLGNFAAAYDIAAIADFNADGKPDTYWQNKSTGERGIYLMNSTGFTSWVPQGYVPIAYDVVGAADFNGDGKPDTLWQNTSTGERGIYLMNGTARGAWIALGNFSPNYRIAVVADFNADGKADTLWQNTANGECGIYLMNGTAFTSWVPLGYFNTNYVIVAAADYNNDGKTDTVWQNTSSGECGIYLMNGTAFTSWIPLGYFNTQYRIAH